MDNKILNLLLIKPSRHKDKRGYFSESYNLKQYLGLGINLNFVQDNHSLSYEYATIRGLHYQAPPFSQGKLVSCLRGTIFDVAVDIRRGSPTYGHWEGHRLSSENGYQLYIPVGFAHGFVTLEPNSEIIYKCTNYYDPKTEGAIHWDSCGIEWPQKHDPILSEKDEMAPMLKDLNSPFVYGNNS